MAYIKEYWQNKEQRATIAREHTKEMQNKYGRCIQTSILGTKIYDTDSYNRDFEEDIEDKDTKIIVENIDLPFGKTKIKQLIKSGELPLMKIGNDYITTFSILEEWIKEHINEEIYY